MQPTSLVAHEAIKPLLGNKQAQVLAILQLFPAGATLMQLSDELAWAINRVTGRVNELVKSGKVRDSGRRRQNRGGHYAIVWEVC